MMHQIDILGYSQAGDCFLICDSSVRYMLRAMLVFSIVIDDYLLPIQLDTDNP